MSSHDGGNETILLPAGKKDDSGNENSPFRLLWIFTELYKVQKKGQIKIDLVCVKVYIVL